MDRGAWRAAVYEVAQSRTQLKRLSSSSQQCIAKGIGELTEGRGHPFWLAPDSRVR